MCDSCQFHSEILNALHDMKTVVVMEKHLIALMQVVCWCSSTCVEVLGCQVTYSAIIINSRSKDLVGAVSMVAGVCIGDA